MRCKLNTDSEINERKGDAQKPPELSGNLVNTLRQPSAFAAIDMNK